jgi:hypothetical protein
MGLINEEGGSALIINDKGNLQNKDGDTFTTLADVTLTGLSTLEAKFGLMYVAEFTELESGEIFKVYFPERYFNSFAQRALLFSPGDPIALKPWRIEAKQAKGVKVCALEDSGYQAVNIDSVKQQTENLPPWEQGKQGWDSTAQSEALFEQLKKQFKLD